MDADRLVLWAAFYIGLAWLQGADPVGATLCFGTAAWALFEWEEPQPSRHVLV